MRAQERSVCRRSSEQKEVGRCQMIDAFSIYVYAGLPLFVGQRLDSSMFQRICKPEAGRERLESRRSQGFPSARTPSSAAAWHRA